MKRLELIIEPHKLSEVRDALRAALASMTSQRVKFAAEEILRQVFSDVRLETVVSAERAAEVIRAFAGPGWRALLGDSKMLVYEVTDPVRKQAP